MNVLKRLLSLRGRRILLVGLFIILVVFGGQIEGPSPIEVHRTDLQIGFKEATYKLPSKISARPGDHYRLSYWVRALAMKDLDVREIEGSLNATDQPGETVIKTFAIGPDKKELVDTVSVPVGREYIFHQKIIETTFEVADLLIERETNVGLTGVNLQGLVLTRLNAAPNKLGSLRETISSSTTFGLENVAQTTGNDRLYAFMGRSKTIAQVFIPKNPYVAGVDLRLTFHRTGGKGGYNLALARVISKKNNILEYQVITDIPVDVQDQRTIDEKGTTYHLPLFAKVEPGQAYVLLLSSVKANTNLLHLLDVKGTTDRNAYADGAAFKLDAKNRMKEIGDLYFQVFGADFPASANGRYLNGQVVEDRGQDMLLTYTPARKPSDLLDLDTIEVASKNKGASVRFDTSTRQIVGAAVEGTSYTYKLVSPSPILSFYLSAGLVNPVGGQTLVSYSTDGQSWIAMNPDARGTVINRSYETPETHTIYFRVSYQGEPTKEGLFGLLEPLIQARAKR